ncbi:MAG: leucine-rich repeat domain-containing protein [Gemmatimonadetes bacterium]|nr:leucine-rich repeat domain-containing protein [Gemmatimonadota bacterium]
MTSTRRRWKRPGERRRRGVAALGALALAVGCAGPPAGAPPVPSPSDAALVVPAGPVCSEQTGATVVSFADANLEHAIRMALGEGAKEALTCAALSRLTSLHAPDARIQDLSGIENVVGLTELYIYGNNSIRDITPLSYLPALADLNLARNDIADVGPLAAIHTLTSLDLTGNPITDIAPIGRLTALTRLRIGHGAELADLGALRTLAGLTRLELDANGIVDLRPLALLSQLTRLSLQDNEHLSDLGPVSHLRNLEVLSVGGTAVADLSALGGLSRLTTLDLAGTRVHDLGPLLGLADLARLDLTGNMQLSDVQPLLFHTSFGAGDAIRLERTGVSCTDVAALETRGVTVVSGCR